MKTLSDHNTLARGEMYFPNYYGTPRPNGLACDKCGHELIDSSPNVMLASNPPQLNVHCPKCGFTGYRFA